MCYTIFNYLDKGRFQSMNSVHIPNEIKPLLQGSHVQVQLSVPQLVEKVLKRKEGTLTSTGAICVSTGKYTGRSPQDKFIVMEESTKNKIDWGTTNQPISEEIFKNLYHKVLDYLREKEEIYVFKGFAGADKKSRLPIQVINEYA